MDDSKILITGANGQLGLALRSKYPRAKSADINELDITSQESVNNYNWSDISIVINAAAFTNVDGAETQSGRISAWKVNAEAVANLVRVAAQHNLTLVHISSDYVFDGTKNSHLETEDLSPLGVYGQTKAAGDVVISLLPKHYLVRTSWVIGDGKNFVRTMLSLGAKGVEPSVVNDQVGRLTFTDELVEAIDYLLITQADYGTYNVSNDGEPASWADVTREIFKLAGYDLNVTDVTTAEYFAGKDNISPRPLNSVLSLDKVHGIGFVSSDWHEALANYIKKELNQ